MCFVIDYHVKQIWGLVGLTIKGEIAIVKAKPLPLITYVTNFIYVPKDVFETIDKLLYEFVWTKKHHVKRSTLIEKMGTSQYSEGFIVRRFNIPKFDSIALSFYI